MDAFSQALSQVWAAQFNSASVPHLRLPRADGYAAHERVPMDHWCVTRNDLRQFRLVVQEAVHHGHILPTDLDPFDIHDDKHGPCVHTVVSMLIKPVTHIAGGQSVALMLHPDGLKCDLFVTHGWAEGIYEFIDKVLNAWPRGARNAYCCMLSNPQNLDIGGLIASPQDSPFAKALASATYMLVIPNRKGSIYSRIWCVYEAYLAYKWRKTIYVATFAPPGFWIQLAFASLLPALAATIDFYLVQPKVTNSYHVYCFQGMMFIGLLVLILPMPPRTFNYVGLLAAGILLNFPRTWNYEFTPFNLMYLQFWIGSEADRMRMQEANHEAAKLRYGYSGKVCQACSSLEEDKTRIMQEIQQHGEEELVNQTIAVLLRAGMSTAFLRKAETLGIDIDNAGDFRTSVIAFSLCLWLKISLLGPDDSNYCVFLPSRHRVLRVICTLEGCVWLMGFLYVRQDLKAYAANILLRLYLLPLMPVYFFFDKLLAWDRETGELDLPYLVATLILGSLVLWCSSPSRTLSIPVLGALLARFAMAKSRYCKPNAEAVEQMGGGGLEMVKM